MIVVKVELHSAVTGKVTEIGRTIIANVGGTLERGEYDVSVARKPMPGKPFSNRDTRDKPMRRGQVHDYPRLSYNVWRLVIRALLSAFPEEEARRVRNKEKHHA